MVRPATFARLRWYPQDPQECRASIDKLIDRARSLIPVTSPSPPKAGIVPHAGWVYSGLTMASVYHALAQSNRPDTLFLLGSTHVPGVSIPTLWDESSWESPLGSVEIDSDWTDILRDSELEFDINMEAHIQEHSIEIQIPFVRHFFPNARIVPIMVPPTLAAKELGEFLAAQFKNRSQPPLVVATTDLTHYGDHYDFISHGRGRDAHDWVREINDPRMLQILTQLQCESILNEARSSRNACSPGPLLGITSFVRQLGYTQGTVLHYTTSAEVTGDIAPNNFVGYAGVVFG